MAQQRALFISEAFIKNNTEIDDNVSVKQLLPTVFWCQKAYIERVLGSVLYEKIEDDIIADTLTGSYQTLVESYIADALVSWFMMEVQIALLYNYRNKSTDTGNTTWSQPIDNSEVRFLKDQYKKRADYFTDRLEAYLCANSSTFTEYSQQNTSDQLVHEDLPPNNPVFLGMPRRDTKYIQSSS